MLVERSGGNTGMSTFGEDEMSSLVESQPAPSIPLIQGISVTLLTATKRTGFPRVRGL